MPRAKGDPVLKQPEITISNQFAATVDAIAELPASKEEVGGYLKNLWTMLEEFAVTYGGRLIIALLILIIGFKIVNTLTRKLMHSKAIKKMEGTTASFLRGLVNVVSKVLIGIVALSVIGVPMTSIITVVGSCGLAVGLALQGSLANIAGGFVLLLVRPFKVGQFITVGEDAGTVTEIGIFNTKIRTLDNRMIIFPNSTISNATVVNLSEMPLRRLDFTFSASYGDDIGEVKSALLAACGRNELILQDPAPKAFVSGHKDSAVEYTLWAWCKTEDYWTVYCALFEDVKRSFDARGVTIPFPQLDVHPKN